MESKWNKAELAKNDSVMMGCYVVQELKMLISLFLSFWDHMTLYRANFTEFLWSCIVVLKSAPCIYNRPSLAPTTKLIWFLCTALTVLREIPKTKNMVTSACVMYTCRFNQELGFEFRTGIFQYLLSGKLVSDSPKGVWKRHQWQIQYFYFSV